MLEHIMYICSLPVDIQFSQMLLIVLLPQNVLGQRPKEKHDVEIRMQHFFSF